jgi:hypothetical protein
MHLADSAQKFDWCVFMIPSRALYGARLIPTSTVDSSLFIVGHPHILLRRNEHPLAKQNRDLVQTQSSSVLKQSLGLKSVVGSS